MAKHAKKSFTKKLIGAGTILVVALSGQVALGSTTTAGEINSFTITNQNREDTTIAQTSYKGFQAQAFGTIVGDTNYVAVWYACTSDTLFKSTDTSNAGNQVADEAAIDAALSAAGCQALTTGGFNLSATENSGFPRQKQNFADFDAVAGKQFVTMKLTATQTGKATYAISAGWDRPTIAPRTFTVSGSGAISAATATTEGDFGSIFTGYQLCDSDLTAQNDISNLTANTAFAGANCKLVQTANGGYGVTNATELYEDVNGTYVSVPAQGFLHLYTVLDNTVFDISAGVDISSFAPPPATTPGTEEPDPTPPAATPYMGPVPISLNISCLPAQTPGAATLSGERLSTITAATVDGKAVTLSAITSTSLRLALPALASGTYDITYHSSDGSITHQDSLRVCDSTSSAPAENTVTEGEKKPFYVAQRFTNYRGDIGVVAALDRRAITMFIQSNPGLTHVTCVGSTSGQPVIATDQALAMARAKNACSVVESLVPGVEIKLAANTGRGIGQFFRAVTLFGKGTTTN
jgi:hypothetical protein